MSVFGYIRFSYFGRNDTKLSRYTPDEDARFAALYSPERMEERFYFFENLTMPSLRAQSDPDFQATVVASEIMPDPFKSRLATAVADTPQVDVVYSDAPHINDAVDAVIAENSADLNETSVHFRLDDDDAVFVDLIKTLRARAPYAQPDALITLPRGLYLTFWEGKPHVIRKFEPYIALGFAFVNRPGQVRNPYNCKHGSHYRNVPSMMDPGPYAYVHCAHPSSDTREAQQRKLNGALKFDKNYGTNRARQRIGAIVAKNFPGFTLESLEVLISEAPGVVRQSAATCLSASGT